MLKPLSNPQTTVDEIVHFIEHTFIENHKQHAVVAVSGGIDSALSVALTVQALGPTHVTPLFLPYGSQSTADAQLVCQHLHIPSEQWHNINIQDMVDTSCRQLQLNPAANSDPTDKVRVGNIMARSRMIVVFDTAKKMNALVCGTENKSEHFLGYFTRFGDAASDLEPISSLYKTHVRQLVAHLQLPSIFITKAPSAGLWADQTDEAEMGFTYDQADQVLHYLIDEGVPATELQLPELDQATVQKIITQVTAMRFKLQVPYEL